MKKNVYVVLFVLFSLAAQIFTAGAASVGLSKLGLVGWWWLLWVPLFFFHGFAFQTNREKVVRDIFKL